MTRSSEELRGITLLGNQHTQYKTEYAPEVLEAFDNKHPDNDYFVKFICPEFTSLCPMTGQPDFATIHIRYIPGKKWWKANPSSCICSASAITAISTKTASISS